MSDLNPNVPIVLGGKTRHLRLDFGALEFIEEKTGFNLLTEAGWEILNNPSPKKLNALVTGLLIHEDETITTKNVGSWITMQNLREVMQAVKECVQRSTGNEKAEGPAEPVSPLSLVPAPDGPQPA